MLCDLCKKGNAVIFLERKGPDGLQKICLCDECARERGITANQVATDQKNVAFVFKELMDKLSGTGPDFERLCPGCGKSLGDIKRFGVAGCPECYTVFTEEIRAALESHKFVVNYTGSLPKRLKDFRNALTDRADLQAKLEKAVSEENYEKAAVYRDFLRALEKSAVSDGEK
ncbi:MAG: UvrB/UvrC motif-containing protein [Treponema sp.]|uniref:UvrB/UvrC motif-containing protein n=1 Tax=Treponema sp. TaxID=166 RepID=UPI00257E9DC2|nr:UvrB/UvrC motif-containing protein [Treponema sp.]MBQ5538341.1 UvrB/UvrC motif-containing protein [Treponema sp.]